MDIEPPAVHTCIESRNPIAAWHARFLTVADTDVYVGPFFGYNSQERGDYDNWSPTLSS